MRVLATILLAFICNLTIAEVLPRSGEFVRLEFRNGKKHWGELLESDLESFQITSISGEYRLNWDLVASWDRISSSTFHKFQAEAFLAKGNESEAIKHGQLAMQGVLPIQLAEPLFELLVQHERSIQIARQDQVNELIHEATRSMELGFYEDAQKILEPNKSEPAILELLVLCEFEKHRLTKQSPQLFRSDNYDLLTTDTTAYKIIAGAIQAHMLAEQRLSAKTSDSQTLMRLWLDSMPTRRRYVVEYSRPNVHPTPERSWSPYPSHQFEQGESRIVYTTDNGTKYHTANCSYLNRSRYETTLKYAISSGLGACSRCNPPLSD